ncbi:MAG TPA: hypothetical protein VJ896_12035 [Bacteroidales bacterium]|nr:hypothetical protein [Bacteroidales bacterium]
MSTKNDDFIQHKIHTGFRLTKTNYKLLEELENELGINKTSVINMILSLIKKDKSILVELFKTAINK